MADWASATTAGGDQTRPSSRSFSLIQLAPDWSYVLPAWMAIQFPMTHDGGRHRRFSMSFGPATTTAAHGRQSVSAHWTLRSGPLMGWRSPAMDRHDRAGSA